MLDVKTEITDQESSPAEQYLNHLNGELAAREELSTACDALAGALLKAANYVAGMDSFDHERLSAVVHHAMRRTEDVDHCYLVFQDSKSMTKAAKDACTPIELARAEEDFIPF